MARSILVPSRAQFFVRRTMAPPGMSVRVLALYPPQQPGASLRDQRRTTFVISPSIPSMPDGYSSASKPELSFGVRMVETPGKTAQLADRSTRTSWRLTILRPARLYSAAGDGCFESHARS